MGGRVSRGVAHDTKRELAWLDTGAGGVQLMRFQPIPSPLPTYSLPPHPPPPSSTQGGGVIQVQPRPQKGAGSTSIVQEKLPTLQSGPQSQSYTQRQLETYFKVLSSPPKVKGQPYGTWGHLKYYGNMVVTMETISSICPLPPSSQELGQQATASPPSFTSRHLPGLFCKLYCTVDSPGNGEAALAPVHTTSSHSPSPKDTGHTHFSSRRGGGKGRRKSSSRRSRYV